MELVAGTSLERYGLLTVPREGGPASLRAVESPERVLWTGSTELPAAVEARPLGASVVLKTAEGAIHRYDPVRDRLEEFGSVSSDAVWTGYGDRGLWVDRREGVVVAVGEEGAWRYDLSRPLRWAAPVEDAGVVALVGAEEGPTLWLLRAGQPEPEAVGRADVRLPALVTAWGRRLVFTGADGRTLVTIGLPQLAEVDRLELEGEAGALAASPSSHQLYAGTASAPRVVGVNRFTGRTWSLARLERPARALRPTLFGDGLLAHDGAETWWLSLEGGAPTALPTEWREDLPLGLPGGRVLALRDGVVRLLGSDGAEIGPALEDETDAWWVPVRWRPLRPAVVATPAGEREGEAEAPTAGEDARESEAVVAGADQDGRTPGGEAGDATADVETERPEPAAPEVARPDAPPPDEAPAAPREMDAGFYAIVASSQRLPGVADLASSLGEAGFPARLQRHRDEAGEIWYRCLVGPYASREGAEEAAATLRRERGLQGWITEVAPDVRTEEIQG